ncbi:MAG: D-alanyl-D-alanine carboxypeptidase/D-alanyl-D-alanine-endopeptidase [Chloroflexota bacterium]|nr:D-alanyl-D-alanine carboxypeptidase/D-alanyl-D-alanine-endopeptidase [Chloroflexota bacterium]
MSNAKNLSRRATLRRAGGLAAAAAAPSLIAVTPAAARQATPVASETGAPLPAAIIDIIEQPKYGFSRWGIHVEDQVSGEAIHDQRGTERFLAASTTKLFTTAAALHAYGPDFRFETPIYRQGEVDAEGTLAGDLILVASGDPTLGGRTTPEGGIAYVSIDHIYANAFPIATLTLEDPLAGIDDLAGQVKASGIDRVDGEIVIDDRLFPAFAKDDYILSPVWINDNLIDLTIVPGATGEAATLDWRPQSVAYAVSSTVTTVAAGQPLTVTVSTPADGVIEVAGEIPADQAPLLRVVQVEDPAAFARTVLIEALNRAGVEVGASPTGPNPIALLPAPGSYAAADRVATLESLPFAENIKLINKVSHNQHADLLVLLLALSVGETTFDVGMDQIRIFLEGIGLDPTLVSLSDGRGNEYTDLFSPRTVSELLRLMTGRDDFAAYFESLPILGVDGSEATTVPASSAVAGQARAKSGTTVAGDLMNNRPLVMTRALAGYMTARSGRELIFAIYVNDVPIAAVSDLFTLITEQGTIAEIIFEQN